MNIKLSHIALIGIFAIAIMGFSRVYALTGPQSNAPTQPEIATPINNSGEMQTKKGAVISQEGFGAGTPLVWNGNNYQIDGSLPLNGSTWDTFPESSFQDIGAWARDPLSFIITPRSGMIISRALLSPWGFFTRVISSSLIIGGNNPVSDLPSVVPPVADATGVKIDLIGRGTANNSISGTQAISVNTGTGNMCSTYITARVTGPIISFVEANTGNYFDTADVIARQVRLTGGKPKPNSILIGSVSGSGGELISVWGTPQVVNGQIQLVPNP